MAESHEELKEIGKFFTEPILYSEPPTLEPAITIRDYLCPVVPKMITSYGIIATTVKDDAPYFLLIKKRHSYGYVDIILGNILTRDVFERELRFMTVAEKRRMLKIPFRELWNDFWYNHKHKTYRVEYDRCFRAYTKLIGENIDLLTKYLAVGPEDNIWEFPKGRKKPHETSVECAIREFTEETKLIKQKMDVISDMPFVENYSGTDDKKYRSFLYVGFCKTTDPIEHNFANGLISEEVSDAEWFPYWKAYRLIDDSKKKVLKSVCAIILYRKFPNLKLTE